MDYIRAVDAADIELIELMMTHTFEIFQLDWERQDMDRDAHIAVLLTLRMVSKRNRDKALREAALGEGPMPYDPIDYELDDDGWPVYNNP